MSGLSRQLQIGKAAEYLVCSDLILKGMNAFLADQGSPYDVIADLDGKLYRVQVKATSEKVNYGHGCYVYRFGTRRAKGARVRASSVDVDCFAFVAIDRKIIGYLTSEEMTTKDGRIKQTIDFKSRDIQYDGRIYSTGKKRTPEWGRYLDDISSFPLGGVV